MRRGSEPAKGTATFSDPVSPKTVSAIMYIVSKVHLGSLHGFFEKVGRLDVMCCGCRGTAWIGGRLGCWWD